jgi:hypothetical protein
MTSNTPTLRTLARNPVTIACSITILHFLVVSCFFASRFSTPDASGYFTQGRLLATEGQAWFTVESPSQYVPTHWHDTGDGRFHAKYPPGLPLLLALAWGIPASLYILLPGRRPGGPGPCRPFGRWHGRRDAGPCDGGPPDAGPRRHARQDGQTSRRDAAGARGTRGIRDTGYARTQRRPWPGRVGPGLRVSSIAFYVSL